MTAAGPDPRRAPVPHRASSTLLGLVLPLALLAAGAAVALSWRDELPDPVATHFGTDGTADGYASLASLALGLPAVMAALVVALWLLAVLAGRDASTRRWCVGTAVFVSWLGAALTTGALAPQRGLADASATPGIGTALAVALLGGAVLGVAAAAVVPRDAPQPADEPVRPGERIALGDAERAVWTRRVRSPLTLAVGGGGALGTAALAVGDGQPAMLVVPAVLTVVVAASAAFTATVDDRGLTVRSALGVPRFRVPLAEVLSARATAVQPLREFGGWGYRLGRDGRVGVVLRRGPALEVERTGGRRFVVTVDDPQTAAALLATLAERRRRVPAG